ncbi:hypothetical protein SAMN05660662_1735 [Blastococcus aurantiacus]|uniref:Uncharacterized protein n=1 Tax=Blastococcus aurantiacus TaxID=1550231 RepID=A0A1G7JWR0_9ACTN|nr:hypothetical protein [Blastococcus aurantiacus]SDF28959.1 hypothetical protein SAMN05660662_1735 [Blastococcus aurantiacus]
MAGSLLLLGLPFAALCAVVVGFGPAERWLAERAARRRARHAPPLDRRPLQAVAADVRRLRRQLALVPAGAPMARRRALQAAYDDVLTEAARMLGVPHALATGPPGRARDVERLRLLAALQAAGLAVGD